MTAPAGMTWQKRATLPGQTLYPHGWPQTIATGFAASKYIAPALPSATPFSE